MKVYIDGRGEFPNVFIDDTGVTSLKTSGEFQEKLFARGGFEEDEKKEGLQNKKI